MAPRMIEIARTAAAPPIASRTWPRTRRASRCRDRAEVLRDFA